MKNRKGFTLIEILAVVVILAVISVTVGISMNGLMNRQKEKHESEFEKTLENAACVYAEKHMEETSVAASTLISAGLLKKDTINPKTGKVASDEVVAITWKDGRKACKYNGEAS